MALKGIKVIEMLGLAPGPFCGMLLAEFGASVTIVDKIEPTIPNTLGCGKKNIALNLKDPQGIKIFKDLCKQSDVLIEPFRPGTMEKLGIGPNVLMSDNPRLIYARLTGYGQHGDFHKKAGHDINYISISGLLSLFGRNSVNPLPPLNFAADFAGGGLMCTLGIVMALFERISSNRGQIIDSNMVEGTAYISSWIFRSQNLPLWSDDPEKGVLNGGAHFYNTYKTKDEKYMAVGAIEPKFYYNFLKALKFPFTHENQFTDFEERKLILSKIFLTRTQKEWSETFKDVDACVTPVLTLQDAETHSHNTSRNSFIRSYDGEITPKPAPYLSRTPAKSLADQEPARHGENTEEILSSLNYSYAEIGQLRDMGIVYFAKKASL